MHAIEADNLARRYAPGRGVCGVSFIVQPGECYAVLGRNGSGKSTLWRMLTGLDRPDSGRLRVLDADLAAGSRVHLARCGVQPERVSHWPQLSGRQNATFVARSYGVTRGEVAGRLAELFELADLAKHGDEPVASYSYGMQRKLGLVGALCHEPDLLILDEPTMGLDVQFVLALAELIRTRCAEGKTTWLAGNDADWLASVASRVAFMDAGAMVAEGTVAELLEEISTGQEVRVELAEPAAIPPPDSSAVRSFVQEGNVLTAVLAEDPAELCGLISWVTSHGGSVRSVDVRRATLKEAFLIRTGGGVES